MSIKLPRHVKIGPVMFSVKRCDVIGRNRRTWGNCGYSPAKINIKGGLLL